MTLTLSDFFCGAGGSSTGTLDVAGVEVRAAANHWDLAVETHRQNHPEVTLDTSCLSRGPLRTTPRTSTGADRGRQQWPGCCRRLCMSTG